MLSRTGCRHACEEAVFDPARHGNCQRQVPVASDRDEEGPFKSVRLPRASV